MCWKVLKENWGPIHSLLAGPMWVTISTWVKDVFWKNLAKVYWLGFLSCHKSL